MDSFENKTFTMPYNNINARLDDAQLAEHLLALEEMQTRMPFLVNLTPKERQAGKLGQNKLAFVKAAYDYAQHNSLLIPPALNIDDWNADIELLAQLVQLQQKTSMLLEALDDTTLALRKECQKASLQFYKYAQVAANSQVPGVDVIVDDLKKKLGGRKGK
jgi:hypothetical protein